MKRVYKYPLRVNDRQIVKLPKGAEILSVQIQRGDICLWALIDTSVKETNDVAIRMVQVTTSNMMETLDS